MYLIPKLRNLKKILKLNHKKINLSHYNCTVNKFDKIYMKKDSLVNQMAQDMKEKKKVFFSLKIYF